MQIQCISMVFQCKFNAFYMYVGAYPVHIQCTLSHSTDYLVLLIVSIITDIPRGALRLRFQCDLDPVVERGPTSLEAVCLTTYCNTIMNFSTVFCEGRCPSKASMKGCESRYCLIFTNDIPLH